MAAGRTPKQAMGDSKKRKPKGLKMPKVPAVPAGLDLPSLRSWVTKPKAMAISAKAKRVAVGKVSTK